MNRFTFREPLFSRVVFTLLAFLLTASSVWASNEVRTFTFNVKNDNLSYIVYNNNAYKMSDSYYWNSSSSILDHLTISINAHSSNVMTMADSYQNATGYTYCLWGNYTTTFNFSHDSKYIANVKIYDAPTNSIKEVVSDQQSCSVAVTYRQMYKIEVTLSDTQPVLPVESHEASYLDESGIAQTVDAKILTDETELTAGWWVVESDVIISSRIKIKGMVNLILSDGVTLTADKGITVGEDNRLNIYAQANGTGTLVANGQNEETGSSTKYFSGIGGYQYYQNGRGMVYKATGTIAINGGVVTATGRYGAPGIGGGDGGYTIIVNGGTVTANGGSLAAGIGSGRDQSANPGTVMINGGTVTATGGAGSAGWGGAGIGGGDNGDGGTIVITGGHITATAGGDAAGIGAGRGRSNATVNLGWSKSTDQITASSYVGTVTLTHAFMLQNSDTEATLDNIGGNTIVPKHTIYFAANGGKGTMSSVSKAAGTSYELPEPAFTNYGHYFMGWDINSTIYAAGASYTVDGDITASATWLQITCHVNFNMNGYGSAIDGQTVNYGAYADEPVTPTAAGYTFGGWFKEQSCENRWVFNGQQVFDNLILYAKWTKDAYAITYDLDGGVNAAGNPVSYTFSDNVTLLPPTKTGYTFLGWTGSNGEYPDPDVSFGGEMGDKSYTAHWQISQYTITFDTDGGTPAAIDAITADYGTPVDVPAPVAKHGFLFERWKVSDDDSDMPTSMPGRNITVVPEWSVLTHYDYQAPTCREDGIEDCYRSIYGDYYLEDGDHVHYIPVSDANVKIPALDHQWETVAWSWGSNNYAGILQATLELRCSRCGRPDNTITNHFTTEVTVAPTASTDGLRTYTATVEVYGSIYSDTYEEIIPRTGAVALIYNPGTDESVAKPYLYTALYDARSGEEVQVLTDIDEDWATKVAQVGDAPYDLADDITLNLNGHSVKLERMEVSNSLTVKNGTLKAYINNTNVGAAHTLLLDNATLEAVERYDTDLSDWSYNIQWMADNISVTNGSSLQMTGHGYLGSGDDDFSLTIDETSNVVLSNASFSSYNMRRVGSQLAQYLPQSYSMLIDGEHGSVIYDNKAFNGTVTLQPVTVANLTAHLANGNYWTTYYNSSKGFKIADTERACAYTATYAAGTLTLHKLGKVIPANTAVVIVAEGNSISMTSCEEAAEYDVSNDLRGTDVSTSTSSLGEGTFYVLGNQNSHFGFHEYKGTTMVGRKAYLLVPGSVSASALTIVFDDGATGVNEVRSLKADVRGEYYNLAGQRVAQPTKGLYIANGRKVVIQ